MIYNTRQWLVKINDIRFLIFFSSWHLTFPVKLFPQIFLYIKCNVTFIYKMLMSSWPIKKKELEYFEILVLILFFDFWSVKEPRVTVCKVNNFLFIYFKV